MDTPELEAMVQRARQGDAEAPAEIHRMLFRRVLGLCWHMLGSGEDAEDACSEVFMRLPRIISDYDGSIPFERWLLSIAGNRCVDVLRRKAREQRLFSEQDVEPLSVSVPATSSLNQLVNEERREAVRQALAQLPARFRVPLALRYYSELSYDEIGSQLGLKRAHVATLIFRAKQELRQRLMEHGEE